VWASIHGRKQKRQAGMCRQRKRFLHFLNSYPSPWDWIPWGLHSRAKHLSLDPLSSHSYMEEWSLHRTFGGNKATASVASTHQPATTTTKLTIADPNQPDLTQARSWAYLRPAGYLAGFIIWDPLYNYSLIFIHHLFIRCQDTKYH
jgi:hypothetical protein